MSLLKRFAKLRYQLLVLVLVPLLLLSGSVILLTVKWSSDYTYEQLFAKVNTDLRVASERFHSMQQNTLLELKSLAGSATLANSLQADESQLWALLVQQQHERGFDFLRLWSADRQRVLSESGWLLEPFKISPLSARMPDESWSGVMDENSGELSVKQGRFDDGLLSQAGIEVYETEDWQRIPGITEQRVLFPLVATARAAPSDREHEDRAMIIRGLQLVVNDQGRAIALLEAGVLLNRNFDFVDEIRDLVYGRGSLAPGSRGTVTVFLDDVRVTTNVPSSDDTRALGTRVSREVRSAVLERGEQWVDRAFVVNDWYISAYEPIIDVTGDRVGMLYAGYLESPFREQLKTAITILSTIVIAGCLLAGLAAIIGARAIFRPIESISGVVRATAAGMHQRIGPINSGSEISELATQFDAMLDTLESHRQRIERDSALLEDKVQHRTAELEQQNRRLQDSIDLLQQTRRQLANAEKLAALGELTAGVAHEINNPTAVILGNMDVLVADLGVAGNKVQTEIDLIIEQVYRIRSITDRLLQYSRSKAQSPATGVDGIFADRQPVTEAVDLQSVVGESLTLMNHEFYGKGIAVSEVHGATLMAVIDRQELQQVLINLLSNAIHAIDSGGQIVIETADENEQTIALSVSDSGCGMSQEQVPHVFDPFFTSGKIGGTGLGLSVSYGIVRRFGGDMTVQSELGAGSRFRLFLPGRAGNPVSSLAG